MTREASWRVEGMTLTLLRHITGLGYVVSVFRLPSTVRGRPGSVEMHAVEAASDTPAQHIASVGEGAAGDVEYRCACLLAEMVGINPEDG